MKKSSAWRSVVAQTSLLSQTSTTLHNIQNAFDSASICSFLTRLRVFVAQTQSSRDFCASAEHSLDDNDKSGSEKCPIDSFFLNSLGIEKSSFDLEMEELSKLPLEAQLSHVKKLVRSQEEVIGTLRHTANQLLKGQKRLEDFARSNSIAPLSKRVIQLQKIVEELQRSKGHSSGDSRDPSEPVSNTKESVPELFASSIGEKLPKGGSGRKKRVRMQRRRKREKQVSSKSESQEKSGDYQHPWKEWVEFLEYLNSKGYVYKAFGLRQGPVNLDRACSPKNIWFVLNAALNFAEDNAQLVSRLSDSDLKRVVGYSFPSIPVKFLLAQQRLKSIISNKKVSESGYSVMKDVVRLLFLSANSVEKSGSSFPDDIKQSVISLLKEILDNSKRSKEGILVFDKQS
eukprot:TRINITY_DN2467_c0_g1_i2.p1 TRINITY_DN2467_c0_g1~~TRINITY_DN2467_c0_g1_i2.p1  ORF type:complete len:400 (-),score=65.26 TRINITY_DN2467_c0_g1_i2:194-1393(-)